MLVLCAWDAAVTDLFGEREPLHPRNNTFPGEVLLRLAADALAWSGVSPADPLPLEAMRERFLPKISVRGTDRRKLQYAVLAAAALHGGVEPDLLDEVGWWQADDFWRYALLAAIAYVPPGGRAGARSMQATGRKARPAAQLTARRRDAICPNFDTAVGSGRVTMEAGRNQSHIEYGFLLRPELGHLSSRYERPRVAVVCSAGLAGWLGVWCDRPRVIPISGSGRDRNRIRVASDLDRLAGGVGRGRDGRDRAGPVVDDIGGLAVRRDRDR
jgi:hypothetical protein